MPIYACRVVSSSDAREYKNKLPQESVFLCGQEMQLHSMRALLFRCISNRVERPLTIYCGDNTTSNETYLCQNCYSEFYYQSDPDLEMVPLASADVEAQQYVEASNDAESPPKYLPRIFSSPEFLLGALTMALGAGVLGYLFYQNHDRIGIQSRPTKPTPTPDPIPKPDITKCAIVNIDCKVENKCEHIIFAKKPGHTYQEILPNATSGQICQSGCSRIEGCPEIEAAYEDKVNYSLLDTSACKLEKNITVRVENPELKGKYPDYNIKVHVKYTDETNQNKEIESEKGNNVSLIVPAGASRIHFGQTDIIVDGEKTRDFYKDINSHLGYEHFVGQFHKQDRTHSITACDINDLSTNRICFKRVHSSKLERIDCIRPIIPRGDD